MLERIAILTLLGCGSPTAAPSEAPGSAQPRADQKMAMRNAAFAINGHIVVLKNTAAFAEYREVIAKAKQVAGVVSAEPLMFSEATAVSAAAATPIDITVKGVDPAGTTTAAITPLLTKGTFNLVAPAEGPPSIVLGDALAAALVVKLGDDITITGKPSMPPPWETGVARPYMFRVTGMIHTGVGEYDHQLTYVDRAVHQDILGKGDSPMAIELRVADYMQSAAIARAVDAALGGEPYQVQDWRALNPALAE